MRYIFSNSCSIIINKVAEHSIEENFVECVENINCEFTGRQQGKRYEHLNTPADFHIDEKWNTANDLDVFAQWIDTGTNKQKDVVFKRIHGKCLIYLLLSVLMLLLIRCSFM